MPKLFKFGKGSGPRKTEMPNLSSGITKAEAEALLTTKGFNYSSTTISTEVSGLADTIASQSVPAGTIMLIGSDVSFVYYTYTAPPYFPYFPTFIACGACDIIHNTTQNVCNGIDLYVGNYQWTEKSCSDGTTVLCTYPPQFVSYGSLIEANAVACGGTGTVNTTPDWQYSYSEYRGSCCATVAIYVDQNPNSSSYGQESTLNCASSGGSQCASPYFPSFTAPPYFPSFTAPPYFPSFTAPVDPCVANPCQESCCPSLYCYCSGGACYC